VRSVGGRDIESDLPDGYEVLLNSATGDISALVRAMEEQVMVMNSRKHSRVHDHAVMCFGNETLV